MFRAFCQIFLWALLTATSARATCTGNGVTSTVALPASLTVPRDLPAGSIIYDTGWVGNSSAYIQCDPLDTWSYGYSVPMTPTASGGVYETSVQGIGVRTGWSNTLGVRPGDITQAMIQDWPRMQLTLPNIKGAYLPPALYRVQLIKTGDIAPGVIAFQNPIATSIYGGIVATSTNFTSTQVNIKTAGCRVTNSNITVNLPKASAQGFSGVGSTQGTTAFSIPLVCDAGINVAYELDGPADASNAPGVLANQAGSGMATGVGVQVLQGNAPVTLGAVSSPYIRTTRDNETVSIPMAARYYKTSQVVTSGSVNAIATLNMNYQ
ncbi:Fimbria adhesin protein [Cupriavidus laharis]|uniref:Fimbria adhesin protein n=1 Tax=Cupriavidus laharis TaxID=151654 RepID=A0ABN7YZT8_9BURK|nr:fimbrial protein [Cupriavidus laharis]CAG9177811.1 Fimbria adhesin protein [Cupriavidus laharis]